MFKTSTGLDWLGVAGLILLPDTLFHHQFITESWKSTKKTFIMISLLVPKLFTSLCLECFVFGFDSKLLVHLM